MDKIHFHTMNQGTSRRIFIGIPITEENCPKFFAWARNLINESKEQNLQIRWSQPENYHITICFLGDSDHHPVDQIVSTLSSQKFSSFWIQIQELGFFKNSRNSDVMWAGVQSKEIHAFQEKIQNEIKNLGYKKEFKPFRPHITIGRIKEQTPSLHHETISTVLDQYKVTKFCLFESFLSLQHIQYRILETFSCT